ncbi:MAG: hypothetical protein U5O39_12290 [Gammaproteobacteria bacterium]|nr:hypothetical protein [Gammaproteobacteria bacterium]
MVIHNCGIGYEFSTLRPKGAYVTGAGAYTSGPLSFMDIYDKMCFTVSSAGGRRGAQMATFDVGHPDVMDFIRAKREDGRLRQFNLSLLITDEFMEAVKADADWPLSFPMTAEEVENEDIDLTDTTTVIWRDLARRRRATSPTTRGWWRAGSTKTIKARRLWDMIMTSTYDYAEPGFILIDKVNEMKQQLVLTRTSAPPTRASPATPACTRRAASCRIGGTVRDRRAAGGRPSTGAHLRNEGPRRR